LIAYRLTRIKYANDLAGTGGLHAAGRCNHKGTPVIYAAQQPSLALAEVLAHMDLDNVPWDYVLVTIDIPDTVPTKQATPEEALTASADPPCSRVSSALSRRSAGTECGDVSSGTGFRSEGHKDKSRFA
jgi:RES domain-containing protein